MKGQEDSRGFGVRQVELQSWPCCVTSGKPPEVSEPRFSSTIKPRSHCKLSRATGSLPLRLCDKQLPNTVAKTTVNADSR